MDGFDLTVYLSKSSPPGSDGSDLGVVGNCVNGGVCSPKRRICAVEYFRSVAGTGYVMAHEVRRVGLLQAARIALKLIFQFGHALGMVHNEEISFPRDRCPGERTRGIMDATT